VDKGEAIGVGGAGNQRRRMPGVQVMHQARPVGFQLVAGGGYDVGYTRFGDGDEALDEGRVVNRRGRLGQSHRAPPMGVQRRQPLGQRQPIGQGRRFVGGGDVGGRHVVEEQVVAAQRLGIGGVVAAHQRRVGRVDVVAGIVRHFRRAERFVVKVCLDHLQEEPRRSLALRAVAIAHVENSVRRPVAAPGVDVERAHRAGSQRPAGLQYAREPR